MLRISATGNQFNNTKSTNKIAFKSFNTPLTPQEFRTTGNLLGQQLERVIPGMQHDAEEVMLIDKLKELLLRATKLKLSDDGDLRLHHQLQRKSQSLEPKPEVSNNFPNLGFFGF